MDYEDQKDKAEESTRGFERALWKIGYELKNIRSHLTILVFAAWLLFFAIMGWHMREWF